MLPSSHCNLRRFIALLTIYDAHFEGSTQLLQGVADRIRSQLAVSRGDVSLSDQLVSKAASLHRILPKGRCTTQMSTLIHQDTFVLFAADYSCRTQVAARVLVEGLATDCPTASGICAKLTWRLTHFEPPIGQL